MHKMRVRWAWLILLFALAAALAVGGRAAAPASTPAAASNAESPAVTARVYDVAEILAGQDRPAPPPVAIVEGPPPRPLPATAPATAPSVVGAGKTACQESPKSPTEQLAQLVKTVVDPDSWQPEGTLGAVKASGSMLVVMTTAANHARIETLLADLARQRTRPLKIDARWLVLDEGQLKALRGEGTEISEQDLAKVPGEGLVYRGLLSCFDRQAVHIAAGEMKTYVTGADCQVVNDSGSCALRPIVEKMQTGMTLEVRPIVSKQGNQVTLGISANFLQPDGSEKVDVIGASLDDKGMKTPGMSLDRLNVHTVSFQLTAKIPLGKWAMVAAATAEQFGKGKQLCLVMKVSE